jgi:MoaA/NifB/PqqE/SkfB family radical SAM enzyme
MSAAAEEHGHPPTHDESAQKQPRGRGSTIADVVFRDPEPVDDEARAIRVDVARLLLRAPTLPLELPMFGFRLVDVALDKGGVDLLLGWESPVARLRVEAARKPEALVELGKGPARPKVVSTSIVETHAAAARIRAGMAKLAERVEGAVTQEVWERAFARAKDHLKLPVGVPVGFYRQIIAGVGRPEGIIRVGFRCNQDCGICWQDRDWGRFGAEQTLRWIEDFGAAGVRSLIISGGEPTLDPDLERYIRRAHEVGISQVTLETNAIQFHKAGYVERIRDAGIHAAFVSLHSGDPEVSDAITRAPGTHARTVKGVLALLAGGVDVKFNAVMTQEGLDHLAGLPDFIHSTFGAYRAHVLGLMLSYPAESYDPSLAPTIIPEPTQLRAVLRETIARAVALGVPLNGLDSPCGAQLCAFDADPRFASPRPIPEVVDFRNIYLPACDTCAVKRACFGLRDTDVKLYGEACVAPLGASPRLA